MTGKNPACFGAKAERAGFLSEEAVFQAIPEFSRDKPLLTLYNITDYFVLWM